MRLLRRLTRLIMLLLDSVGKRLDTLLAGRSHSSPTVAHIPLGARGARSPCGHSRITAATNVGMATGVAARGASVMSNSPQGRG
jgi:hypothetical protein